MKDCSSQQSVGIEREQKDPSRRLSPVEIVSTANRESSSSATNHRPGVVIDNSVMHKKIARPGVTRSINFQAACWLFGSLAILVASLLLNVGEERQVLIPWLQWPLPESCGLRLRFGMDCPGCGLTRSFIYLANGDFGKAWSVHSMGCVLFLYTLAQIPLSLIYARQSATGRQMKHWARIVWANERLILVLAALLFLRWLWKLSTGEIL